MADLNKLVEKIKADTELKKQFASAVKENKVAEFCKGLGVEITKEEIDSFIKTKKSELTDEELNKVSGGCATSGGSIACDVCLTVLTAGVACTIASIDEGLNFVDGKPVGTCLA